MKRIAVLVAPLLLAASVAFAAGEDFKSARSIDTTAWIGVPVLNNQGVVVGSYHRQIQSADGAVDYIIVQSVAPSTTMYAIPSNYVQVSPVERILLVDIDPVALKDAPAYMEDINVDEEEFTTRTNEFYGTYAHDYGGFGAVESDRTTTDGTTGESGTSD